ncbi:uncharacterized protein BKA78DRAFT_315544 [Phyllosticta capitalensis]|uniref:uncharacterized protein n=1 Tax=Phyllosticta capitalensis TaxID=121624 RepID=UPI00312D7639
MGTMFFMDWNRYGMGSRSSVGPPVLGCCCLFYFSVVTSFPSFFALSFPCGLLCLPPCLSLSGYWGGGKMKGRGKVG